MNDSQEKIFKLLIQDLVFAGFLLAGVQAYAEKLPDGWSRYATGVDGKSYAVHMKTLQFDGIPPSVVSLNLWDTSRSNYVAWEVHCKEEKIRDRGIFYSIRSETATVRRQIFDGLCGFYYEGGYWIQFGSMHSSSDPTKITGFTFFNSSNLRRTQTPFPGIFVEYLEATFDKNKQPRHVPFARGELVIDCRNPTRFAGRTLGVSSFNVYENAVVNSLSHSASFLFCSGKLQVAAGDNIQNQKSEGLSKAPQGKSDPESESKCAALGYLVNTEPFKRCVEQIQKGR